MNQGIKFPLIEKREDYRIGLLSYRFPYLFWNLDSRTLAGAVSSFISIFSKAEPQPVLGIPALVYDIFVTYWFPQCFSPNSGEFADLYLEFEGDASAMEFRKKVLEEKKRIMEEVRDIVTENEAKAEKKRAHRKR